MAAATALTIYAQLLLDDAELLEQGTAQIHQKATVIDGQRITVGLL